METKICSKCKIEKSISEFYKDKSHKDGLTSRCKECCKQYLQRPEVKEHRKEYRQQPEVKEYRKEYCREYHRKYLQRPEIKEHQKKHNKEYYQQNKEWIKKQHREYYQQNKERIKKRIKKYQKEYIQRPEVKKHRKEYYKEYYRQPEVKEHIKEYIQRPEIIKKRRNYMKSYRKLTRHTSSQIRLNHAISSAISDSLRGNKNGKHWEDLVDFTLQDLKIQFEKQFDLFMNWENQGTYWHIDHIKPKSLFTFTSPEDPEFKECWALSNLRPLEAGENIRKGANYRTKCHSERFKLH